MDGSLVSSSAWDSIMTALQAQISVSAVVEVLAVLVGASIGLVFMWWGVRKLISVIMGAFRKGKVTV